MRVESGHLYSVNWNRFVKVSDRGFVNTINEFREHLKDDKSNTIDWFVDEETLDCKLNLSWCNEGQRGGSWIVLQLVVPDSFIDETIAVAEIVNSFDTLRWFLYEKLTGRFLIAK